MEALEDVYISSFTYEDLINIYKELHALESIDGQLGNINFITTQNKLMALMNDDAATRYSNFLKTYKNILSRIPKNITVSYLGITLQSLSRLKKEYDVD